MISKSVQLAKNRKALRKKCFSRFWNEAHLWCIKNEVAYGYEALLRNMKWENVRFASCERKRVLRIGEANASFFIEKTNNLCYLTPLGL